MPASTGQPTIPALFADGVSKLIVTECSYSAPPRSGEDRYIVGIYEAHDATWRLISTANLADYVELVRGNYRFRPERDRLLTPDPSQWQDRGNELDSHGPPPSRLDAVLPASPDCRHVVNIPIVNGRVQVPANDPCEELGKNRIRLSNGTVCYGWPTVILDGSAGREIVAEPKRLNAALQEVMRDQGPVVLSGQTDPDRCSPTVLWTIR